MTAQATARLKKPRTTSKYELDRWEQAIANKANQDAGVLATLQDRVDDLEIMQTMGEL